jgi:hypothetical protein
MIIDFNKITNLYNKNLTDKLRGFGEEEFLKFWVPDSEKIKSILNLIDALYESNTYKALIKNIELNNQQISELLNLKDIAFEDIDNNQINICINAEKYNLYQINNRSKIGNNFKDKSYSSLDKLENLDISETINSFYKNILTDINYKLVNIFKNNENNYFEKLNIKISENEKIHLFLNQQYLINDAFVEFKKKREITLILDLFCSLIKNKPFQEVVEHGTIYLEFDLREKANKKNDQISGIFLPHNAGGLFNLINYKFRESYKQFIQKHRLKEEINKFYFSVNNQWKSFNYEKQKNIIENILSNKVYRQFNVNKEDISLNRVINGNRLEFLLSKRLKGDYDDVVLFKIESILKKEIDASIELLTVEEEDSNVLRLSNAPKSL